MKKEFNYEEARNLALTTQAIRRQAKLTAERMTKEQHARIAEAELKIAEARQALNLARNEANATVLNFM